jgi:hypothetical protein
LFSSLVVLARSDLGVETTPNLPRLRDWHVSAVALPGRVAFGEPPGLSRRHPQKNQRSDTMRAAVHRAPAFIEGDYILGGLGVSTALASAQIERWSQVRLFQNYCFVFITFRDLMSLELPPP